MRAVNAPLCSPYFRRRGDRLLKIIGYKQQYFHYKPMGIVRNDHTPGRTLAIMDSWTNPRSGSRVRSAVIPHDRNRGASAEPIQLDRTSITPYNAGRSRVEVTAQIICREGVR